MKKISFYITILVLAIMGTFIAEDTAAQGSATAVMEVRVEVVAGSSIERDDKTNLFSPGFDEISYGEFSLNVPDGTEVLASSSDKIEMQGSDEQWLLDSRMNVEKQPCGTVKLSFTANASPQHRNGLHKGIQIATIEYL
jgi:hypothetical protein